MPRKKPVSLSGTRSSRGLISKEGKQKSTIDKSYKENLLNKFEQQNHRNLRDLVMPKLSEVIKDLKELKSAINFQSVMKNYLEIIPIFEYYSLASIKMKLADAFSASNILNTVDNFNKTL
ncbi:putative Bracovirus protein MdBV-8-2 [Microplitis demolitor]